MSRYKILLENGHSIAYGYDKPTQAYFLDLMDENGDLLKDYSTNKFLTFTGNHVSRSRMLELFISYNIPKHHCQNVAVDLPF